MYMYNLTRAFAIQMICYKKPAVKYRGMHVKSSQLFIVIHMAARYMYFQTIKFCGYRLFFFWYTRQHIHVHCKNAYAQQDIHVHVCKIQPLIHVHVTTELHAYNQRN